MGEGPGRRAALGWYALAVALVAAPVTVALALWRPLPTDGASLAVLLGIAVLQAASCAASGWLQRRLRAEVWQLDPVLFAVGLVLASPSLTCLALAAGTAIGLSLERARPASVVIGTAHSALGVAAVAATVDAIGLPRVGTWTHAGVVMGAVIAFSVVMILFADLRDRLVARSPFWRTFAADLRFSLVRTPFIASLAYVTAVAGTVSLPVALLAVPSVAAMVYVLAEHFRAERDRDRAETLYRTAEELHSSIDVAGVAESLESAACRLLGAASARVGTDGPAPGELGVELEGQPDTWLVVRGAPNGDPDNVLQAIAAMGSSALENARLVEEITHQAVHDRLTGLPNKVLFDDRVQQAIAGARRSHGRFAVVALDLDAFRKVNDSLGHDVGDELLRIIGTRLCEAVRAGDTVARLSSDVFVLLLAEVGTAEAAGVLVEKLLAAVGRPLDVSGQEIFMTACAGLAFYPDDGQEAGHLLRNADSALHRAKREGPGSYEIYAQGMNEAAHQRLARESELHQAVRREELRVRYQPQVDLRTGRIVAVEALVRWDHPTLGMLAPGEFVPLAEESGLIVEVDSWVLREATRQAAAWLAEGLPPVRIAVNLSSRHFQSPERLVGTVRDVLADSALPPALLELEVTEGLAVHEDRSAELLQRLRDFGVSISVDDFGTGYSMLGRLHRFPVDRLKIDRSFIREITSARADAPIVSAIIAMARSLGIETVAEGVETLEQQTFLRNRSCDLAQGFLFSAPTDADQIARLVQTPSVGFNPAPLS